jgi:hypothetical protein
VVSERPKQATRREGLRRISRGCRSCCVSGSRFNNDGASGIQSTDMVPARAGTSDGSTGSANPTHGSQALFKRCPPAIRGTTAPTSSNIVIGAPRIVLRRSGFCNADESRKHSQDEERKPHGGLLMPVFITATVMLCCSRAGRGATDRGEYRQAARAFAQAVVA